MSMLFYVKTLNDQEYSSTVHIIIASYLLLMTQCVLC